MEHRPKPSKLPTSAFVVAVPAQACPNTAKGEPGEGRDGMSREPGYMVFNRKYRRTTGKNW